MALAMVTACIFAPELNHALETVGFYFRIGGTEVVFATETGGDERTEHPWSLRRVMEMYDVREIVDKPVACDVLVADAFLKPQYSRDFANWATLSNEVAFLFPEAGMTFKRRLGHLVRSWPHSLTSRTAVFFGDSRWSLDTLTPAFQRRTFFAPYLHPQSFTNNALDQVFGDYSLEGRRRYQIGFMGNKNPPERSLALLECRDVIGQLGADAVWIEYGDDEHHKALTSEQFISKLGEMDFCICPTGWARWTHRVIESLCRGAIPILQDTHLYGLGLVDGVNCILVKNNDWFDTVKQALNLPISTLEEMRRNVLALQARLVPSAASHRFQSQFQQRRQPFLEVQQA